MFKKFGVFLLLISFLSVGSFVVAQDADDENVEETTSPADTPAKKEAPAKKEVPAKKAEKKAKKEKKGKKAKKAKKKKQQDSTTDEK